MLKIILHRGLYKGTDPEIENNPAHIKSIIKDYDCEIDLRIKDKELYLGHDYPQYKIDFDFLLDYRNHLYIHCKDTNALYFMSQQIIDFHYFYHENDYHALTSKKFIWQAHYRNLTNRTIVVDLSETPNYTAACYGICVDYVKI